IAPAHQLRLSLTGSEDGEAETETCRVAKPLWRKTNRPSGPSGLNLTEPPGADPHAGWCGRGEWASTPPMPLRSGKSKRLCRVKTCENRMSILTALISERWRWGTSCTTTKKDIGRCGCF